ncbi:hypothetical protein BD310DRAFT_941876 [Dichomitus squalens]|uniref:Uncharacterized protein n=1 Tax=Dichomitus squalens TaxID=114155 RepID=A0A4Q9PAB6_9APHY|nr:hypothetical protein BD310DRAFT_941876 [Dichomitus squalens]
MHWGLPHRLAMSRHRRPPPLYGSAYSPPRPYPSPDPVWMWALSVCSLVWVGAYAQCLGKLSCGQYLSCGPYAARRPGGN